LWVVDLTADLCAASDCAGFVLALLLAMVYLDTSVRLLIGMGKKLKPEGFASTFWHISTAVSALADAFYCAQ